MQIQHLPPVHLGMAADACDLNAALLQRFEALKDHQDIRRTHFVHGRYENIYLEREQTPEILPLIEAGERAAREILNTRHPLRCGHWFNWMDPGHRTSLHSHEENDELLSAVYYVTAPERSGDLVLDIGLTELRLRPVAGLMVLFPPDLPHSVETNKSDQARLSIAFNFGPM